jgi:hypothetical protein
MRARLPCDRQLGKGRTTTTPHKRDARRVTLNSISPHRKDRRASQNSISPQRKKVRARDGESRGFVLSS